MSYILKLKTKDGQETVFPGVDHFQVTPVLTPDGQSATGLEFDIQMNDPEAEGGRVAKRVKLPKDGADLYMTSDESGATLDSWHWPPHAKKIGRRDSVKQVFRVTETNERSKQNG